MTATAINVGAISTRTGAIASDFNGLVPGIQAYFDMVNAQGGINGRKLNLAYNLDDGGQPSQFTQLTHTLIDQDHAFAVMVASYWFTPNYFVETKTPTYGYNVSGNWQGPQPVRRRRARSRTTPPVYRRTPTINKDQVEAVAFISYGPSIASSYDACNTAATDLKKAGYNVSLRGRRRPAGRQLLLGRAADAAGRHPLRLAACRRRTTSPWPGTSSSTG